MMGTISHDAMIVMGYDADRVEKVRRAVVELAGTIETDKPWPEKWQELVSPVIPAITNGYACFFIAPDGSKEWWDTSDEPIAVLRELRCEMRGCSNEVEGRCSMCLMRICGSCFNGEHEWSDHGPDW